MFGTLALTVAVGSSILLAVQHLSGLALPGCGPESACAQLAASVWGRVPGLGWPVSFVGAAYFTALLVGWIVAQARFGGLLRSFVVLGAVLSVGFIVVMIAEGHFCKYCVAAHVANLAFVYLMFISGRPVVESRAAVAAVATFTLVTGGLLVADLSTRERVAEQAERDRADSTTEIINTGGGNDPSTNAKPFTGRFRLGPETAAIRIVSFIDYQCEDCARVEGEIMDLVRTRDDVSLSVKHFPMNPACNPGAPNLHANACWAARAAEAAGILHGNEGYWAMHEWLFTREHLGAFTAAELDAGLAELGFDRDEFVATMTGDETLARIQADTAEAHSLGLRQTPMVFINGVQFRGWNAAGNPLTRTVNEIAATNPEPRTAAADRPPPALEKFIEDWRVSFRYPPRPVTQTRRVGPANAAVEIILYGDYEFPLVAAADRAIRAAMADATDVSYEYRHYPFDESCNDYVDRTAQPNACRMARIAEAAHAVGGADAFWAMHERLLNRPGTHTPQGVMAAATELGLDPAQLTVMIEDPQVDQVIRDHIRVARTMGVRGIPWIFVNQRRVQMWRMPDGTVILDEIVDAARREAAGG